MASRGLIKSNSGVRGAGFRGRDQQPITRPGEESAFGGKSPVFQWVCATDNGSRRFTEVRPVRRDRGRKRQTCHKPRVTGAASGGIRAFADIVAERIDAKVQCWRTTMRATPGNEECTKGR